MNEHPVRKSTDHVFDSMSRKQSFSGMDVVVFDRANNVNNIRLRCFLPTVADGRYQVNYNLPNDITTKEHALEFLSSLNLFFLTIRRKGLSTTFWLGKYSDYSPEDYSLVARFKRGKKDRIVLKTKDINLKKFKYIDDLVITFKQTLGI